MKNRKMYHQAPLPFQGQKRKFIPQFVEALREFEDKTVFVDLFGGSGLLSHVVKRVYSHATIVYNDYDNYSNRLANIPRTNKLLGDLRTLVQDVPNDKKIPYETKTEILNRIASECGYIDFVTLSSSLLFSGKYVNSLEELSKQAMYNVLKKNDYSSADDYLLGIDIVSKDYSDLFFEYCHYSSVVFLVDPPYLSTDVKTYTSDSYWKMKDYLDVLTILKDTSFFYFTSNKSNLIELCEWLENNGGYNPFNGATRRDVQNKINHKAGYLDIMLYKNLKSS